MTPRRRPLRITLLPYLLGNDEPLVGDLIEEWPRRSTAWFWRQVMFAMFGKVRAAASATVREPQRLTGVLASAAILLILSFQVVVAGSLLDDLIQRFDRAQVTRIDHPEWLVFVVLLSIPLAWLIGKAVSSLHRRSRVATVLVCGASGAAVGAVTVSVLGGMGSFLPSAAHQTAAGMLFVIALLVGSSSCSPLDRRA